MLQPPIDSQLERFAGDHNIRTKGQLCVVLVVSRIAKAAPGTT
jgi:hypothetical protein